MCILCKHIVHMCWSQRSELSVLGLQMWPTAPRLWMLKCRCKSSCLYSRHCAGSHHPALIIFQVLQWNGHLNLLPIFPLNCLLLLMTFFDILFIYVLYVFPDACLCTTWIQCQGDQRGCQILWDWCYRQLWTTWVLGIKLSHLQLCCWVFKLSVL